EATACNPRIVASLRRAGFSIVNPDGDAIGSALALGRILRTLGKGATVWLRDPSPSVYLPLPGASRIHHGEDPPAGYPDLFSCVIVLECPTLERTGIDDWLVARPILNIDHHLGNGQYGEVNWVEASAPAVGEMVYRLSQRLKIELDHDTANLLYLTLVTDTGNFRFSNATSDAFEAAAALVRDGASPEAVSHWLFESQPVASLRLLGEVLRSLELHDDGRIATVWLTQEMLERTGAAHSDSEGLIDYPRSIAGVEAVAMFRELEEDGHYKVSLRSRGTVDVEAIARGFDGGGHRNAAGCARQGDRDDVVRTTVEALQAAL
ncbi:MAG: bifunctional oligoribonuclease/PAP phosphatase NrnA, partial [Acidobacteriota bacterium]